MDRFILGERGIRIGLVALAIPQLGIGFWALISPSEWFETFPGAGNHWLPLYGPFDEHLVSDVGSTFLALGVLLVLAAAWMDRRVVIAAAVAYLVYQVPHTIYHLGADDVLSDGDQLANGIGLVLALFLALGVLVGALRSGEGSDPTGTGHRQGSDPRGTGQRPVKFGGRFSAKARTPSMKSEVRPCSAWAAASASSCSARSG
jgi:hypothetical protein